LPFLSTRITLTAFLFDRPLGVAVPVGAGTEWRNTQRTTSELDHRGRSVVCPSETWLAATLLQAVTKDSLYDAVLDEEE
jgi:hypothetical protein